MTSEILAAFFFGGLVGLDTTAAWQTLLSHPLAACSLIGAVFGEPQLGLFFGIIFELVWLYDLPIGGARFPEGSLGSFVGFMVALSILNDPMVSEPWLILFSCVYTILVAYIFGISVVRLRKFNLRLIQKANQFAESGDVPRVEQTHRLGLVIAYVYFGALSLGFFLIGHLIVRSVIKLLPATPPFSVSQIQVIFLGVGLTVMFQLFFQRRSLRYLLMGIGCGILLAVLI